MRVALIPLWLACIPGRSVFGYCPQVERVRRAFFPRLVIPSLHRIQIMQTVYKRLSVLAGFVLLLIVLIVNAWITRREVALQYDNQHWAAHSRHILLELSLTEALLANAESA